MCEYCENKKTLGYDGEGDGIYIERHRDIRRRKENEEMMTFDRKSYGRIFVQKEEDIEKVKEIIKEMDEFEFGYLPKDFITVFSKDNMEAKYTHKFCDLDTQELTKRCWENGIYMFCWYGRVSGYEDLF